MKRCTKCKVTKDESEFYKDSRNKSNLVSHCKACVLARQKGRPSKKYPVKTTGTKTCKDCKETKDINLFSVNRTRKTGREHYCKLCWGVRNRNKRRAKGKIYFVDESQDTANFYTGNCEICNEQFKMMRSTHKRCKLCTKIVRDIQSHCSGSRSGKSLRCSVKQAVSISKRYIKAAKCCYCKQEFTEENQKSLDHVVPFIKGGTHDPENINISCFNCNMAKRDLDLDVWIDLCKRVAASN